MITCSRVCRTSFSPSNFDFAYSLIGFGTSDSTYMPFTPSNTPSVDPFTNLKFAQPIQNFYPQLNRDDPKSDPKASVSFAIANPIGQVVIDDPQRSITKETVGKALPDFGIGIGLTNIVSNSSGTTHTFYTRYDHGFAGITSVSLVSAASSGAEIGRAHV